MTTTEKTDLADHSDERFTAAQLIRLSRYEAAPIAPESAPSPAAELADPVETAFALHDVLVEVAAERARQDEKWGEQNHPDGTGPDVVWAFTGPARWVVKCALDATDAANDAGAVSWRDILVEEVAEAIAEDDPAKLRAELIQVAAVCVQWVQAIDRRALNGGAS